MRKQVGPSSRLLSSLKAVRDFMKDKDDVAIIGFFDNEQDKLLEQYLEANNDVREDYAFGHTFDPAAKKHYDIKKSSIVLFQPARFQSKYEPKHFIFEVSLAILDCMFKQCLCVSVFLISSSLHFFVFDLSFVIVFILFFSGQRSNS